MELKDIFNFIQKDIMDLRKKEKNGIWKVKDKSDFVYLMGEKLINHSSEFEKFTECEKVFYLCNCFDNEVQSWGGFYSVYVSDIGAHAYELSTCFKKIGAEELASIIEKVNLLFDKKLSVNQTEREEYIDSINENIEEKMNEYFEEYSNHSNDLYLLLYDYAIKNKDNFKIVD